MGFTFGSVTLKLKIFFMLHRERRHKWKLGKLSEKPWRPNFQQDFRQESALIEIKRKSNE